MLPAKCEAANQAHQHNEQGAKNGDDVVLNPIAINKDHHAQQRATNAGDYSLCTKPIIIKTEHGGHDKA